MSGEISAGVRRRYRRVKGPFSGRLLGPTKTLIFITDLNLGGGFINFFEQPPQESTFVVRINLHEGPITVNAETVSSPSDRARRSLCQFGHRTRPSAWSARLESPRLADQQPFAC